MARPSPPAAATPSTAQITGLGARFISLMVEWRYSRICLKISPYPPGTGRPSGAR